MTVNEYLRWLRRDWAKAGLIAAGFLLVMLFAFVRQSEFLIFVLLLQTPLYMLHQGEEYVFPGGFGAFFNRHIFKPGTDEGPVDESFIFAINIGLIWIALPACALLALVDVNFGLWTPNFSVFAGVAHIALALRARKVSNPGLVVSLVVNIPVGVWSVLTLVEQGVLDSWWYKPSHRWNWGQRDASNHWGSPAPQLQAQAGLLNLTLQAAGRNHHAENNA